MSLSIQDAEKKIEHFLELKNKYNEAKLIASKLHSELEYAYSEMATLLEEQELTSYKGKKATFSYSYEESVQTPKSIEDKKNLAEYIKSLGGEEAFWNMFGINSQSLNAFYKEQLNQAVQEGNFDFNMPGVIKSPPRIKFTLRKTGEK